MRRIDSSAGFTMLEVLVAILILVVALTEMVGLTATVVRANTSSKASTTATTLAGEKLEELKNTDYASLTDGTNTDYATSSGTVQTSASGAYFTRSWTIATVDPDAADADPSDDMKNITVSVTWSWMGNSRQVTLSSSVAQ
ncbi:type IV pilus modification PilV family protein [Syntrophus gentianae]|nr:prepilin-type N-terminal cleavage/methylation domain-containing protein [Syntrophus gentianae]